MPAVPRSVAALPDDARPFNLMELLHGFDRRLRDGRLQDYRPTPLGFPLVDECLGGGLHAEDLVLLGGVQNVGKTIVALQVARNMARTGAVLPIVVCYEHSPDALLHRLICMESIDDPDEPVPSGVTQAELQAAILDYYDNRREGEPNQLDLQWVIERLPGAERAWYRMQTYVRNLWLVRGDGLDTTIARLAEYIQMARALNFGRVVLIVDYAQRVSVRTVDAGAGLSALQRIDFVMRGLKGLALQYRLPVLAVAAADADGLRRQRVHVENLWGPSTVQYEPDAALILNRDALDGESGERTVRLAIEKNRSGPSEIEFRHKLHGAHFCLSETGALVPEAESFQVERIALRSQRATSPGLDPTLAMLLLAALQSDPEGQERGLLIEYLRRAVGEADGRAGLAAEVVDRSGLDAS